MSYFPKFDVRYDDTMQMEDIPVANLVAPPVDAAD